MLVKIHKRVFMNYIKGKIKKLIFYSKESGFVVALFRVKESNVLEIGSNKTITITGSFLDPSIDVAMTLYGDYKKNDKWGMQFVVESYEVDKPTTKEAIIDFLSSPFIEGCGEVTAKRIVEAFGEKSLDIIKNDKEKLLEIEGLTEKRAEKIHASLINYDKSGDTILKLQNLGFSIEECYRIYNYFKDEIDEVLANDFYRISEIVDFRKVDSIYVNNYGDKSDARVFACILESMRILSFANGDTFYYADEIRSTILKEFYIELTEDVFLECLDYLENNNDIIRLDKRIYLKEYYEKECNIAKCLKKIDSKAPKLFYNIDEKLKDLEEKLKIDYNETQEKAIKSALNNNITIISGGPGTGKTTIINAIVKLYIEKEKLGPADIMETIALLAPTGRAAKKMNSSTGIPAYTIHRYLKWYKDSNEFVYNEYNKTHHKLIIVDEVSMIDVDLFNALLNGISSNVKLILVGDTFQLPSVGPGLVLNDLIDSDFFNYVPLNQIYRQSDNSYIPFLAKEIKNNDLSEEFLTKKDDYNFVQVDSSNIKSAIKQITDISLEKGLDERSVQVLAPMYKGEAGIDALNSALQEIYNPPERHKDEVIYGEYIYREGDKVLQLVNDLDNNVFNGDIGFIEGINGNKIIINFDGNRVEYDKKDLKQIKHAYAISIHKSQGSEFTHVLMPISKSYYKMLYNKLIYTGVSRAKKSLTLVGDAMAFQRAVGNNYSSGRKTSLKEQITMVYNS
ncbi:ATP-dependent RecD-like DNA helicase [bacterium]|nr:ATP-dependent RecD-like DNA helicase [bacterium]